MSERLRPTIPRRPSRPARRELAGTYKQNGQFVEAEKAIRRVFQICDRVLPHGHPLMVSPLLDLASALNDQQDYVEADALAQRAFAIATRFRRRTPSLLFGPSDWFLVHITERGDYEKLEQVWQQFIETADQMGRDDRKGASSYLQILSRGVAHVGDVELLLKMTRECTRRAEQICQGDISTLVGVHLSLANALSNQQCCEEARTHIKRLSELASHDDLSPWPDFSSSVVLEAADLERVCGNPETATQHAEGLLNPRSKSSAAAKATAWLLLGRIACARNDPVAAETHYRNALRVLADSPKSIQAQNASMHVELAQAFFLAGQHHEVLSELLLAHELFAGRARMARDRSDFLNATVGDIDVTAHLQLLVEKLPSHASEIKDRIIRAKEEQLDSTRRRSAADSVEALVDAAKALRGHLATDGSPAPQRLTPGEKKIWDRAVAQQAHDLLQEALRLSSQRDGSFPTWQIRQELEIELARYLVQLHQFEEAESHLIAVLTRTREV